MTRKEGFAGTNRVKIRVKVRFKLVKGCIGIASAALLCYVISKAAPLFVKPIIVKSKSFTLIVPKDHIGYFKISYDSSRPEHFSSTVEISKDGIWSDPKLNTLRLPQYCRIKDGGLIPLDWEMEGSAERPFMGTYLDCALVASDSGHWFFIGTAEQKGKSELYSPIVSIAKWKAITALRK